MFKATIQNEQILERSSSLSAFVPHSQNADDNPSSLHMMLDKTHSSVFVIHGYIEVKAPQDPEERRELIIMHLV